MFWRIALFVLVVVVFASIGVWRLWRASHKLNRILEEGRGPLDSGYND